jgi:hypothetical protein
MKRILVLLVALTLVLSVGAMLVVYGAAPSSGDGIPEGSGFDVLPGPVGNGEPFGPAPNSGDGVHDGSGLPAPNDPNG